MGIPANTLALTNGKSFNLTYSMGSGDATITPPSYVGWPASGWSPLVANDEIMYVTDYSARPWPITRGEEGTTPATHANTTLVRNQATAGALSQIVTQGNAILTDDNGNVLCDDDGNVLYSD